MNKFVFCAAVACVGILSACDSAPAPDLTKTLAIGETGKADSVEITVSSAKAVKLIGPPEVGLKAGDGEIYVRVDYTVKNTSGDPLQLQDRPKLTLRDDKGQSYAVDEVTSAVAGTEDIASVGDLNNGVSAKTAAVWKVDEQAYNPAAWLVVSETSPALAFKLK